MLGVYPKTGGAKHEKNVPAQKDSPREKAWLSVPFQKRERPQVLAARRRKGRANLAA